MPNSIHTTNLSPSWSSVSLRAFPYPYQAGLAICSDIDFCDRETFLGTHRFLNSTKNGLGLPVSDSFFGIGQAPGQMAYYLSDGKTPSEDAPMIRHAIRAGLIDSIHSWGDFNGKLPEPSFLKDLSKRLVEDLRVRGLDIKIWLNHGDSFNTQNMHARLNPFYQGDDPDSPYFTADQMKALGVKFYWWSELLPWPLSGKIQPHSPSVWPRLLAITLKNLVKLIILKKNRIRSARQLVELALPCNLIDSSPIIGFNRFNYHPKGIWTLPTRHTLHHALSKKVLSYLIEQEGYMILYTHLGRPEKSSSDPLFPSESKNALTNLSDQYHQGIIWVTPTANLLTYWMTHRYISYRAIYKENDLIINIESINDPTTGRRFAEKDELSGLCFYTPEPDRTTVRLNGKPIKTITNPADHTGKASISIPTQPAPSTDILEE